MSLHRSYPLSSLQAGMLFHHLAHPGNGVDIEQLVVRCPSALKASRLQTAFQELLVAHPILRTRFLWSDGGGQAEQEIVDGVAIPLTSADQPLSDFLAEDRRVGIDLSAAPLLRATLLEDGRCVVLTFHHALLDGRSFPILLDDLFRFYEGREASGSGDRRLYSDYIDWLSEQDHSVSEAFWRHHLADFQAPTPLVVDDLGASEDDSRWQEEIVIDVETTLRLKRMAVGAGATMNTVVQAAWAVLLGKYSGEADVVFGGTRACRKSTIDGADHMLGLFINTLPVRANVDPETFVSSLLRELREQWLAVRPHEHTPLSQVQAWSAMPRGESLFQSILVFENFDLDTHMKALGEAWQEREITLYEKTNFPITVAAYLDEALRIKIEYAPDKFRLETIQGILRHLSHLLGQMALGKKIGSLSLATPQEIVALNERWAKPILTSPTRTLVGWFEEQVAKTPDRVALTYEDQILTYAELNAHANQLGHYLRDACGIVPESLVGLCVERSLDTVIGILGILKSGAGYLPIDLAYPKDRLSWMLEDSGAPVLLTQKALLDSLPETSCVIVAMDELPTGSEENLTPANTPDSLAYVIFTSGSTGKPKGVEITHGNVVRLMEQTEAWYGFDEQDVWTLFHSFAFDFSVWEIWGALLYGGKLVVVPFDVTRSPESFHRLLLDESVTVLNQTPSAFRQLIQVDSQSSGTNLALRYVIFGGEALELASLQPWFDRHGDQQPTLVNMYGITETTVHVTYRPIYKEDLRSGSVIGEPIPDLSIRLLDQQGHPVPVGVPGEIYVGGGGLARGYLNRAELTAERYPIHEGERLYRTGDVARFLPDNDLEYLGRCDEQVKIRGFRIELGEIQSVLCQHADIREGFVCVREDRIVAYLIARDVQPTVTELRQHAGVKLPPYMVPAAFVFIEQFPLTNNGKINRKALPEPTAERSILGASYCAPSNATEATLAEIWSKVLRVEQVGIHDNYFELGGDSILSIQIVSQARAAGLALTPRHLFDHRTIAELASAAATQDVPTTVAPASPTGPAPFTPIQSWFFQLELPNPHHWNQAFLFQLTEKMEPARLQRAFERVTAHHGAFGLRFDASHQCSGEASVNFAIKQAYSLEACEEAQRSLHLHNGPLLSAVCFSDDCLFIAVHHLVVDGVSWRVLLEDLETAYAGQALPPATAAFTEWAHRQEAFAETPALLKQLGYWHKVARDFTLESSVTSNTVADAKDILVSLSEAETKQLLTVAPSALRTQINEILLACVGHAIAEWTGRDDLCLDMEGHGREDSIGLDLSRTIGWFTTIFPVSLTTASDVVGTLKQCKEALRAMPDHGLGYGLLKRWGHLEDQSKRDVVFNYLGQFDQVVAGSTHFAFAPQPSGSWYDSRSERPYSLEINAWVKDGRLEFKWTTPDPVAVGPVAERALTFLRQLLQERSSAWTASDFPLAPLEGANLAALCQDSPETIEDMTALGPLQQLYFTLETARPGSGIDQWHWELHGPVDAQRLEDAWQIVMARHSTLRSGYVGEHTSEPVQIVRKQVDVRIREEVLHGGQTLQDFLKQDIERGLPIDQAPLMRLTLIRRSENQAWLVWTHHHLQIDGWSWPVILTEVSRAYAGRELGARPRPFADHVAWLAKWDADSARRFWRQELAGLTKPTPLPGKRASSMRMAEATRLLPTALTESLKQRARQEGVTLNAVMQTALGILLARQANAEEAVFGASFSGRPAELPGVESIIGAFVNNLPVRVRLSEGAALKDLHELMNEKLVLLGEQQFLPLTEIQRCSEVPLRDRLFETLLVFQNYSVDPEAMRLGDSVRVENFTAPVRTNYPLTLTVNVSEEIDLCAIYQEARFDCDYIEAFLTSYIEVLALDAIPAQVSLTSLVFEDEAPDPRERAIITPRNAMERAIAEVWRTAFGHEAISVEDNFFDLGGHSLLLVQVHRLLKESLKRELPLVNVFRHPTIASLAASLEEGTKTLLAPQPVAATKDIAIIGMSGQFPGADSVEAFWENLVNGVESLSSLDDEGLRSEGLDPVVLEAEGHYVRSRGLIDDPGGFDAAFFDITPREAQATDPQQRRFLELAWSALEDAGYAPSRYRERIGVFAGMSNNTYLANYVQADPSLKNALGDLTVMMGNEKDYLATRTAYKLNLNGPALSIYTACSTSLVALAEAVYALREGRCEMAISGAISLTFPFKRGYYYEEGGITSADGHCRPFDEKAAGTVFSNGMGAVILKPLEQAVADGDTVYAVIKGVGLNNDGSNKVSFTAPSVEGQAGAILQAQRESGFDPETITYVEAHGTGTTLGDPIEVEALTLAFRQSTQRTGFCQLGSVKSNIGHLDAAAGMAGLIKASLALKHGVIPAMLHAQRPNPSLRLSESPFQLATTKQEWASPRRAGVSSFGVGGTNAHIVLEEAPAAIETTPCERTQHLLLLAAKSPEALAAMREGLAAHLERFPDIDLADVAYTLQTGRTWFAYRCSLVVSDHREAIGLLRSDGGDTAHQANSDLPVAFLFPGQGAQFAGMGRELYENEPLYREIVDHAAEALLPLLGEDIRTVIFDEEGERLTETRFTQPALLITSYAMAKLWEACGVKPDRMIGHSVGEYTAACLAGVLSFDDALHLVAKRAELVQAQPGGAMLAVRLPEEEVRPLLPEGIDMAALNSPKMTVVAGSFEAMEAFETALKAKEIAFKRLRTSHAFHSHMMEPVLGPFEEILADTTLNGPEIGYISNVTGQWVTAAETTSPSYWAGHVRQAVRFSDGLQRLTETSSCVFLEVGPGQSLASFARHAYGRDQGVVVSLADKRATCLWQALGKLWLGGGEIDWHVFYQKERRQRLSLPTYPFQHVRHWPTASCQPGFTPLVAPAPPMHEVASHTPLPMDRKAHLLTTLQEEMHALSGMALADLNPKSNFLELGFDSLFLGQASAALSKRFGVKVTFRRLMEDLDTIAAVADYLDQELPPDQFAPQPVAIAAPAPTIASSGSIEERLAAVEQALGLRGAVAPVATMPVATKGYDAGKLHQSSSKPVSYGPFRPVEKSEGNALTVNQEAHLSDLIERYTAFTAGSRAHIQKYRKELADPRAAAGFNPLWKDMVYPIVTKRSDGAKLWDIDGNEWIDVTHGFGLGLFGHRPSFVTDAVAKQLEEGFEIGPASPQAGEIAAMLCEISGKDRVTFCNTGSEAVTAAIRIARTVSQRPMIAAFAGAYHGIFDEVLGRPLVRNGELRTAPIAPGIPDEHLSQILLLDYDNPESLEFIERYKDDLAAVLVEPVQSRRPALQPHAFLKSLREVTARHDIALVFDEVVTGFRSHPKGAQAIFGIDADLVTYGKVLGGGLPIGALAGRSKYMDALDGGHWQFGDDSAPESAVTFFAGTFVRHPLALAAAKAVLIKVMESGPALQEGLDAKVAKMVDEMNQFCEEVNVPIKVTRFSSMYFFNFAPELKQASLFFYHFRLRGIHAWETRPSFLSLAHTDDDIARILTAFRESVTELQEGGFFPKSLPSTTTTFALTEAQQELFLASQMDPDACRACNEALTVELQGPVDLDRLKAAIDRIIDAHESLRTVFSEDGSSQTVKRRSELAFETGIHDAGSMVARQREAQETLFDLTRGPLVRFEIFVLGPDKHAVLMAGHHTVLDGWSFDLLYHQLGQAYQNTTPLPATPFRTYAAEYLNGCAPETEAYWRGQFTDLPEPLELPKDHLLDAASRYQAGSVRRQSPEGLATSIQACCQRHGVTPYVLMLAAYRELLMRLSGKNDVVIGAPIAGQAASGMEGLCGHCVQFLPMRFRRDTGASVGDLLKQTRGQVLDAMEHQQYTLGELTKHVSHARSRDHRGLVSTTFTLEPMGTPYAFEGIEASLQVHPKRFLSFDLSTFVIAEPDSYTVACNFSASKFGEATVARWLDHYFTLLQGFCEAEPTQPVQELPLLSPEDRKRVLVDWNAEALACPTPKESVVELFEKQAQATPDAVAVVSHTKTLNYRELDQHANALAKQLVEAGVCKGDCVGLFAPRSPETMVALVAILKAGAAYVPIDPDYPAERISWMLEDTKPPVILTQAVMRPHLPKSEAKVIEIDAATQMKEDEGTNIALCPNDLAYVIYTSGSTGRPKGVCVPHRGITRLVTKPNFMTISSSDVFLQEATISFDASTLELWGPLLNGATLALPPAGPLTIEALEEAISRFKVTNLWLTAGLFQLIIEERPEALVPVKQLLAGGDVLGREQVRVALETLPCALINGYGPTENTTFTTCHRIQKHDLELPSIPIGRPINGTSVYVLDAQLQPVPIGVPGELYTGGDGLALGYLNHPELTAERFIPNPFSEDPDARLYRIGDRCRYLSDGSIEFLGRVDHQVKVRGFRVELAEVERAISKHPAVAQARVITRGESASDKHLAAFVIPQGGECVDKGALFQFLTEHLPPYMVPTTITVMDSFPLTANGKIDHRQLPEAVVEQPSVVTRAESPLERQIIEIWQDILGRNGFGVHDSFFDIGGHSLLGLRLFTRLHKEIGYRAPLATLFSNPTVASLAARIERESMLQTSHALVARIKPEGTRPPLICIHGGDGGILFYRDLAEKLSPEQPLVAIESPALFDLEFDLSTLTIDGIADTYIDLILSGQPNGPYWIGGYSFGGIMAYDIACKLRERGHEVERLILFDTANPAHEQAGKYTLPQRIKANWKLQGQGSIIGKLGGLTERFSKGVVSKLQHKQAIVRLERDYQSGELQDAEVRVVLLNEIHERVAMSYHPKPYEGNTLLLRADVRNDRVALDSDLGWGDLIPHLQVCEVPGTHLELFVEPYLTPMAEALNVVLASERD